MVEKPGWPLRLRKSVAKALNAHPAEIFFTSGGTESSNTAINAAVNDLGCRHIITSPIEHHAVLHTVENFADRNAQEVSYVKLLPDGHIDLEDLEKLLADTEYKTLVTLMHANNEIGNILDMQATGNLCKLYNAIFHSDTVQTVGHFPFDLPEHTGTFYHWRCAQISWAQRELVFCTSMKMSKNKTIC
jgi:cysteine desulfurase